MDAKSVSSRPETGEYMGVKLFLHTAKCKTTMAQFRKGHYTSTNKGCKGVTLTVRRALPLVILHIFLVCAANNFLIPYGIGINFPYVGYIVT